MSEFFRKFQYNRDYPRSNSVVAVLIEPFTSLGYGVCQYLARRGVRLIVVGRDPESACDFCVQQARLGSSIAFRCFHPELEHAGADLGEDLKRVYQQVNAIISFSELDASTASLGLLDLPEAVIESSLLRNLQQRLNLMRAMAGLKSLVMNITTSNIDQPSDSMRVMQSDLDQQLAREWMQRGIAVRYLHMAGDQSIDKKGDSSDVRLDRILSVFRQYASDWSTADQFD